MKKTVKQRIFRINTLFVLTAITVLLAINAIVAKVYIETIEKDWKNSVENVVSLDYKGDGILESMLRGMAPSQL